MRFAKNTAFIITTLSWVACDPYPRIHARNTRSDMDVTVIHHGYSGFDSIGVRDRSHGAFEIGMPIERASETRYHTVVPRGREIELWPYGMGGLRIDTIHFSGDTSWTWALNDKAQFKRLRRAKVVRPIPPFFGFVGYRVDLR